MEQPLYTKVQIKGKLEDNMDAGETSLFMKKLFKKYNIPLWSFLFESNQVLALRGEVISTRSQTLMDIQITDFESSVQKF